MNPTRLAVQPRLFTQINWRQEAPGQKGIIRHRFQPRLPFLVRPAQQTRRRGLVSQRPDRPLIENFRMPFVAAINPLEVPGAGDNLGVRLP